MYLQRLNIHNIKEHWKPVTKESLILPPPIMKKSDLSYASPLIFLPFALKNIWQQHTIQVKDIIKIDWSRMFQWNVSGLMMKHRHLSRHSPIIGLGLMTSFASLSYLKNLSNKK